MSQLYQYNYSIFHDFAIHKTEKKWVCLFCSPLSLFAQVSRKGTVGFALVLDETVHVQNAQVCFLGGFYSYNTWLCFPCHGGLYMHVLSSGHTELPNDSFGAGISLLLWWMCHCKWKLLWPLEVRMAAIARMLGCLCLSLGKGHLPFVPSFHLLAPRCHAKKLSVEFQPFWSSSTWCGTFESLLLRWEL